MIRPLVIGAGLLAACGGSSSGGYVEADSAGVALITYAGAPDVPTLLPEEPALATVGEEPEFESVAAAAFFPDGGFLVADVRAARVHHFSPEGRFLRSIGRAGAGPLEFRNLAWARPLGPDSIVSYDRALRRLMVFDTGGRGSRSVSLEPTGDGGRPEALALLGDGSLVVRTEKGGLTPDVPTGIHPLPLGIWRYSSAGAPASPIRQELDGQEWVKLESPPTIMPRPFRSGVLLGTSGDRVYVADTYSGVVLTYQTDGSLIRRVKLPLAAEPVSAAHIAAWKEPQLEPLRRSGDTDRLIQRTRMLEQIPFPEHLPVLRRLFVSQDGRLWLEVYPGPEATRRYLVLDTAGRIVARAEGPERALVQDARGDRMLVRWRDSLDRDFVRVHRMTAGRQP